MAKWHDVTNVMRDDEVNVVKRLLDKVVM